MLVGGLLLVAAGGDGVDDAVVSCSGDARRHIHGFCRPVSGMERGAAVLRWFQFFVRETLVLTSSRQQIVGVRLQSREGGMSF